MAYDWPTRSHRLAAWRANGVSTLVTAPVTEPVSVSTLKLHSRITSNEMDDVLLPLRITAARQWVEHYTGRALITQTWRYTIDALPTYGTSILLPWVPLISVTSITTYDTTNVSAVMTSTDYLVDVATEPARVVLNAGFSWPSGLREAGGAVIVYVAGYGDAEENVPAPIRHAILLLAAEWNERIEATTDLKLAEIPIGIRALLDPYRVAA